MIEIVTQQQDETNPNLWYFKISGPDTATGAIRLADLSQETTSPADWLAANPTQAQAAIDAGVVNQEYNEKQDFSGLLVDIANELTWLGTAQAAIANERTDIVTGIGIIDAGATLAQLRQVVRGLAVILDNTLQRQDRLTREQARELKAWRYTIRQVDNLYF